MYQDEQFVVSEVAGLTVAGLFGFTAAADDWCPEKVIVETRDHSRFGFYLSAFLGHWDAVNDIQYEELLRDYADLRRVDYCAMFRLSGSRIESVQCARTTTGTEIRITLDRGRLILRTLVWDDPHSDSKISFAALTA
ncbi:MAG: hypothetical protein AAFQ82_07840 [Myxococcota bacterium]